MRSGGPVTVPDGDEGPCPRSARDCARDAREGQGQWTPRENPGAVGADDRLGRMSDSTTRAKIHRRADLSDSAATIFPRGQSGGLMTSRPWGDGRVGDDDPGWR